MKRKSDYLRIIKNKQSQNMRIIKEWHVFNLAHNQIIRYNKSAHNKNIDFASGYQQKRRFYNGSEKKNIR